MKVFTEVGYANTIRVQMVYIEVSTKYRLEICYRKLSRDLYASSANVFSTISWLNNKN